MTAAIILGHGSRAPQAIAEVYDLARQVKEAGIYDPVEVAFMARSKPSLAESIDKAVTQGARRIVVVPLFLTEGIHVTQDIPEILAAVKKQHRNVEILYAAKLGPDKRIAEILLDRIAEAIGA